MAFRGTTGILNWVQNLKFIQSPYNKCDGCEVHTGFLQTWENMKEKTGIFNYTEGLLKGACSGCKLLITGHSLGAALATLAAFEDWETQVEFINFGSPRVGNEAFAKAFNSKI